MSEVHYHGGLIVLSDGYYCSQCKKLQPGVLGWVEERDRLRKENAALRQQLKESEHRGENKALREIAGMLNTSMPTYHNIRKQTAALRQRAERAERYDAVMQKLRDLKVDFDGLSMLPFEKQGYGMKLAISLYDRVCEIITSSNPDLQPCGHPTSAIVGDREGTNHCGMCAEAAGKEGA